MKRSILRPAVVLAVFLTIFAINVKAQDLNSATLLTRSEQYDKALAMFFHSVLTRQASLCAPSVSHTCAKPSVSAPRH